jgi:UDP-GlcNAc:undecaprenyl-phosphate/decaprenyl-phosphate GlcNAc-1-phosphate transferase
MEVLHSFRPTVSGFGERLALSQMIWLALAAVTGSIVLTTLLIKIAAVKGWVVVPSQNRWSKRTVAQFGGGPVLLIFWLTAMMSPAGRHYSVLLLSTVALALLGFIDDIKGLGPKPKLLAEVLIAACTVSSGIICPLTPSFPVNWVLTVLWIVVMSNAFNIIDNMDGLAGGVAIIGLAIVAILSGSASPIGTLSVLLMFSVGGFFLFNFNPAKIFMGDLGSLPIGFFLASASVITASKIAVPHSAVVIPCLILFVPVFDMFLVSSTRRFNGRAISEGGRDHASHRLVFLGLSERRAVAILHAMALIAGLLAFVWVRVDSDGVNVVLAVSLIGIFHFWWYLARIKLPENWLSRKRVAPLPDFIRNHGARLLKIARDFALVVIGIYVAGLIQPGRFNLYFAGKFWLAAFATGLIELASFWINGIYRQQQSMSSAKERYAVLKGIALGIWFVAPCWLLIGLPLDQVFPLVVAGTFLTTVLLLSSRLVNVRLGRVSAQLHLREMPDGFLPNQTLALIHGAQPEESTFSHFSASREMADKPELS